MKNKFIKKALSVFTAMAMVLSLMTGIPFTEITAFAESNPSTLTFDVSEGSITINADTITYGNGLTAEYTNGSQITITGTTTTNTVTVAKDVSANITLAGVNIDVSSQSNTAAFKIADNSAGNVTITLADNTTNTLKSGYNCAGLQKNGEYISADEGKLTITGTGSLTATGGACGAGIGGGYNGSADNIEISGGEVTATGGAGSAGIGGGSEDSGSNIKISGGTVTATGGTCGAGIGGGASGSADNIKISGGSVKAVAGEGFEYYGTTYSPAAIGQGVQWDSNTGVYSNGAEVTPTDGTDNVYLLELDVDGTSAVTANGKAYPTKHIDENWLYVYLPAGNYTVANGNSQKIYTIADDGDVSEVVVGTAFTITGTDLVYGTDYTYPADTGVLTILSDTYITIKNANPSTSTTNRIEVATGVSANITLAGVNIDVSSQNGTAAFKIADDSAGNVTITLADGTTNTLKSGWKCAGLQKNGIYISETQGKLTITGTGTLAATGGDYGAGIGGGKGGNGSYIEISGGTVTATGGTGSAGIGGGYIGSGSYITISGGEVTAEGGYDGAGIGGSWDGSGSYITISGGTITAIGGEDGAGIGGGDGCDGSNIEISGGTVTATGGTDGAGIGGGYNGSADNIEISGGTVTATGGTGNAGIGGGYNGSADNIKISGGSVKASSIGCIPTDGTANATPVYLLGLNVDGTSAVTINGKAYPTKHIDENRLYVYLPAKTAQAPNEVTIGSTTTKYTYDTTNSKWLTVVDAPEADINKFTCNGVELTYTLAESDYYTISGNKQTNAGTYTVTVSLKENTVWSDGTTDDKEYPFIITCTDADNNGICDYCGSYDEPELDDEYYQIANAGNLMWFVSQVNEGRTTINAKLTANINMKDIDWTAMNVFAGTFDGNGYTISYLCADGDGGDDDIADGSRCGLIQTLSVGGTVTNLTISDAQLWSAHSAGAIAAVNNGTISKCIVKDSSIMLGQSHGLAAIAGTNTGTVTDCGAVNCFLQRRYGAANSSTYAIGAVVEDNSGTVSNCFSYGCRFSNTPNAYAIVESGNVPVNCYYYTDSTVSDTVATAKTADQFASGEVAYLLNGSTSTGELVWGQTLTGENKQACPVLGGAKVYGGDDACGTDYSNKTHESINGFCAVCGGYEQPETDEKGVYQISNAGELYWFADKVNYDNANYGSANAKLTADIVVNSDENISSYNGTDSVSWRPWTPIGNNSNIYTGTFDGNNKTISGLYFNDTNADYVGLFGCIDNGSEIKNVGVVNSYFNGKHYVGGVCGNNYEGTITNCYNKGSVSGRNYVGGVCGRNYDTITNCYNTGTVVGAYYVGGVCGYNITSNTGSYTITNCYNTGSISGTYYVSGVCGKNYGTITNCYNTGTVVGAYFVGGVCGDNNDTTTNCYNTGIVTSTEDHDYVGGVCGRNSGTITNCYYLSGTATGGIYGADVKGSAEAANAEKFASGEVAYLLNGSTSENVTWYQKLETDTYPVLDSKHGIVYSVFMCDGETPGGYSNVNEPAHDYTHTVVAPTYTEQGYTLHECDNCDYSYKDNFTDMLALVKPVVNATAGDKQVTLSWTAVENADGYIVYLYDGEQYVEYGRTIANSYVFAGLKSCTEYKFAVRAYITVDNTTITSDFAEAVASTGHDYEESYTVDKAPTCEEDGSESIHCKNCDAKKDERTISATGHSYTHTVVAPTYYEQGYTLHECINCAYSYKDNFTDMLALVKPVVNAIAGDKQVTLSWTAVEGASYYQIIRYNKGAYSVVATIKSTSAVVKGLTNDFEYTYLINAVAEDGRTSLSTAIYVTPKGEIAKPVLSATAGDKQATLSWTAVEGASYYQIIRYKAGEYSLIANISGTSAVVKGLTNNFEYTYLIKVTMTDGTVIYSNAVNVTPVAELAKPVLSATAGDKQVTLSWTAVEGASYYQIIRYNKGAYSVVATIKSTSAVVKGLTNDFEYTYLIKAVAEDGRFSLSTAIYVTPKGETAKPVLSAIAGDKQATLSWTAVEGASYYQIIRYKAGEYSLIANISGTSAVVKGLTNNFEYTYLIKVTMTDGTVIYSNAVNVTPKA